MEENNKELQEKEVKQNTDENKEPVKRTTKATSTSKTQKATTTKKSTGATKKSTTTKKTAKPKESVKDEKVVVQDKTVEIKDNVVPEKKSEIDADIKKESKTEPIGKKTEEKAKFEPVKRVEKKKKHTGLKFVLILIVIAIVLFLIHYLRNYIIVGKIFDERAKVKGIDNYSYSQYDNDGQKTIGMQFYKKGNTMMMSIKDQKSLIWSNKDLNQTIILNYDEMKATITSGSNVQGAFDNDASDKGVGTLGKLQDEQTYKGFSFVYFISSEKMNGIDCYKISLGQEKAWYNKENGMLVKYKNGSADIDYSDWKFNELTDADVARPNLIGFTIEDKTK